MKLTTLGEFGFISRAAQLINRHIQKNAADVVGIGDDCAVIPQQNNQSLLVTTDMLVETIHFLRSKTPARQLGYKSLAVNLSDIAAMGGKPHSAFISLSLPSDIDVEWLDDFYTGMAELASATNTLILGGDTTRSPGPIVINLTVTGLAPLLTIKYRSTACIGDVLCVTDFLGDSGGGLKLLLNNLDANEDGVYLIQRHNTPRAQLEEGLWLATKPEVHAMMDVSDGIDSDIRRIMEQSQCGATVMLDALPVSDALRRVSVRYGWDAEELAATAGEDYCLLVTVEKNAYEQLSQEFMERFKRPLWRIGVIEGKENGLKYTKGATIVELKKHGFNHFV